MRATRHTADEQYQIIMECRSSGLSDFQWCMEHGIKPGTFYNWVKRLRKAACYDIPPAASRSSRTIPVKQEVVKLEILSDPSGQMAEQNPLSLQAQDMTPVIEISCNTATIRITNEIDPQLLSQVLAIVGDFSC